MVATTKWDSFSSNLDIIMTQIRGSQEVCKYLYYTDYTPLLQPDIANTKDLMNKNLYPYPFNPLANNTDTIQLRVFYPQGKFKEPYELITDATIAFDIIVPVTLYLVNDENGDAKIRPYEISKYLIQIFSRKVIGTLGIVHFKEFYHRSVDEKYDCFRLTAITSNPSG